MPAEDPRFLLPLSKEMHHRMAPEYAGAGRNGHAAGRLRSYRGATNVPALSVGPARTPDWQMCPIRSLTRSFGPLFATDVILEGVAMYRMKLLEKWDTWGDEDVLLRAEYTRRNRATATTYLHVLSIGPDALEAICSSSDPFFYKHMRRRLPAC
jgi:hypothetical protein